MNYCEKIRYNIYTTEVADFTTMADTLLAQLPKDESIFRLVFFGTPANNEEYVTRRNILWNKIQQRYEDRLPVMSYVSQPALDGALTLEVHSYRADENDHITYHPNKGFPYVTLENADGRFLFAGGFHSDILDFNIQQQAVEIFRLASEVLHKENFPIENIIRQWNYIEQITSFDGADQHYQMFNNVRSNFYNQAVWTNGYPAATGIGTNLGGVLVDIDAAVFTPCLLCYPDRQQIADCRPCLLAASIGNRPTTKDDTQVRTCQKYDVRRQKTYLRIGYSRYPGRREPDRSRSRTAASHHNGEYSPTDRRCTTENAARLSEKQIRL